MQIPLTLGDFLDRAEFGCADATALVDELDQVAAPVATTSYRELARRVRAWQAGLDALGVGPGERIAVLSPNRSRLAELLYAVPASGRILVPVNPRLTAEEVHHVIDDSGASVVLADPALVPVLANLAGAKRFLLGEQTDQELLRFDVAPRPWASPDESAVATINYTSGTSARPKGVALTHRNIWLNAMTIGLHGRIWEGDVYLHTLPMFHCNGWGVPFVLAGLGAKQVLLGKIDGAEILRRVRDHGVTLACGAPAVWDQVLAAARDWPGELPGRGRMRVVCAGARPSVRTIAGLEQRLGWQFQHVYGLTETTMLTFNRRLPTAPVHALTSAGAPGIGVRMRIAPDGEVLVRSNMVLAGYWRDEQASAEALADGWFHTGDRGVFDDDGQLVLLDRKKDVIITGGENVSAGEVEDCLRAHPCVAEAVVIGVPHEKWGETVKALIVLADNAATTAIELIAHCKRRLAGYKAPTSVEFLASVPRSATGKVAKDVLRATYGAAG